MISKVSFVLHCIAICSGFEYVPPAPVCPTVVEFKAVDVESTYPQLEIVQEGPYPDVDIYIENSIVTSVVTATIVVLATTTEILEPVTFTRVELIKSIIIVTQTQVETVTKVLENTDINIVTITATNYDTAYLTKVHIQTSYDEILSTTTLISVNPSTRTEVVVSTFIITEHPVITTEVTQQVPYTQAVYVTTHASPKTHTYTETETKTVCPTIY